MTIVENNYIGYFRNGYDLWHKCQYNPISNIRFEYHSEGGFTFKKTFIKFYNEPYIQYCDKDIVGSSEESYTKPVESMKRLFSENKPNTIYYFYTLYGTLIILKGSFSELPMEDILTEFEVEKISNNLFAICLKNRSNRKSFEYLRVAASRIF